MTDFPDTRESLLVQVRDPSNREAWEQFAQIYRPIVYRMARQRGLQDADAQELVQEVFIAVSSAISRWEKANESIKFRNWLSRVAKNAIVNALTRQPRDRAGGGTSVQHLLAEHECSNVELEQQIELEYRRELLQRAAEIVRSDVQSETWQAFELTVIRGRNINETARELKRSIGTIYASRSRVMRRMRQTVVQLENQDS